MVDRCINPRCHEKMKVFHPGEVFWLCPSCIPNSAVRLDSSGAVSCVPKTEATNVQLPDQDRDLRLAFHYPSFQRTHDTAQPCRGHLSPGERRYDYR
jgi:hypothetical protein